MRELPVPAPCVNDKGFIDSARAMETAALIATQIYELKDTGTLSRGAGELHHGSSHFQTMIYINDYPMHARRKVTTKVYMDEIIERTGVAFLSRGSHLPPGPDNSLSAAEAAKHTEVVSKAAGDITNIDIKGLHLIIEGDRANQVSQARAEVMQVINAEIARAGSSSTQPVQGGRYTIV